MKPIVVIYVQIDLIKKTSLSRIEEYLKDYNVIILPSKTIQDFYKIECFYDKDFKETDLKEIKTLINKHLTSK
jgi:hypothetical protein